MKITEIQIKNFGGLHNVNVRPLPGLNVIYGENETGKSTMQKFITGMLFGMEKQEKPGKNDNYQKYEPWNKNSSYAGGLKFTVEDKPFYLERDFYQEEKPARLICEADNVELSAEQDLEPLLGGMNQAVYENTYCIHQAEIETKEEFAGVLQNYFANASMGGGAGIDLAGVCKRLKNRREEARQSLSQMADVRAEKVERLRLEEMLLKKDMEQLNRQKEESPQDASKQQPGVIPPEHDTNQMAEYLRDIRQKNEQQGYRFKHRISLLAASVSLVLGILIMVFHSLNLNGNPIWMVLMLICLFGFLGGAGSVCYWYQKERQLKQIRKKQEQESREYNKSASKDIERQKQQKQQESQAKSQAVKALLQEQLAEKQTMLINLQEEIEETQKAADEELELELQIEAYGLTLKIFENLSKDVYQDTRKQMEEEVSDILEELTHGKYDKVGLDDQMNLLVEKENRNLQPWQLSQGVMEQVYVALRMGAGSIFTQEESMPIILDEVFAAFDEKRLESALKWLGRQKGQIFLFTCQRREMEILERNNIPFGKIMLSR